MGKKGTGLMLTGLLLIAAALCLTVYNLWDDARADRSVQTAMEALRPAIGEETAPAGQPAGEREIPDYVLDPGMEMPTARANGYDYIGVLDLPSLGLELPVIGDWSYPDLKIAPCRYAGSAYSDDLVLAAHNYKTHFGGIRHLAPGEVLTFTDVEGNRFTYRVAGAEVLEPTAIEEMTSGEWDLTLFTCTLGGRARVTVRCERIAAGD